jgi:hypothetical protein
MDTEPESIVEADANPLTKKTNTRYGTPDRRVRRRCDRAQKKRAGNSDSNKLFAK